MSTTIRIDWEPHKGVSPNNRLSARGTRHHHHKARDKAIEDVTKWLTTHSFEKPLMGVLEITWVKKKGAPRWDLDNLVAAYKGAIDGFTRTLGFDDRQIISIHIYQKPGEGTSGYSLITVRESTKTERRKVS